MCNGRENVQKTWKGEEDKEGEERRRCRGELLEVKENREE